MTRAEGTNGEQARQQVEQYLAERMEWMGDAVELISGSRDKDPRKVFGEVGIVRAEGEGLKLSEEQEPNLREIAGRYGIGGEADVKSRAKNQINEPGKPWKVYGEAKISGEATTLIFPGSPDRKVGKDEIEFMDAQLNSGKGEGEERIEIATTEFGMVRQIAESLPGFTPLEEDEVLPFGYDIYNQHRVFEGSIGQLVKIGDINGKDVILLRIDREDYLDYEDRDEHDNPKPKFRNRPDSAAVMGIVSDVLSAYGDDESSIGINSSTTYASRAVDTVRAGLKYSREFSVGMYGRQTLADVRGLEVAEPTEINQIPGELVVMYDKLLQLKDELN